MATDMQIRHDVLAALDGQQMTLPVPSMSSYITES
jgi:hypothetical protein